MDMIEWAGQGVLMGNAVDELRDLAKTRGWALAPPNDEDGVAVVLEAAIANSAESRVELS
jgi:hydroxymethylpyrimidine pyrophosphatase-like HAD family hydrolase